MARAHRGASLRSSLTVLLGLLCVGAGAASLVGACYTPTDIYPNFNLSVHHASSSASGGGMGGAGGKGAGGKGAGGMGAGGKGTGGMGTGGKPMPGDPDCDAPAASPSNGACVPGK